MKKTKYPVALPSIEALPQTDPAADAKAVADWMNKNPVTKISGAGVWTRNGIVVKETRPADINSAEQSRLWGWGKERGSVWK